MSSPSHRTHPLPEPDAASAARSAEMLARIRAHIDRHEGSIAFEEYMRIALYEPALGYYAGGLRKFGAEGDFVTAPESAPLFSRCLARQCAEVLDRLGGGEILEFGAGGGAMAADVITELHELGCAPERYSILEISGELRARQRETLEARAPAARGRVHWCERLPARPIRGVILGNEVLDAMPAARFRVAADGVRELRVGWDGTRLHWVEAAAPPALAAAVAELQRDLPQPLPPGYTSELNPMLAGWMQSAADTLAAGAMIIVDYGYPRREFYHPERRDGTLMCHYRHRAHADPLALPGLQDITAHVDFTAVARAGTAAGLRLAGYTTQAHFLLGTGLERILAASDPDDVRAHLALTHQVKLLTLPGEMGERFKVIGLTRGCDGPLAGFALRDLSDRL